MTVKLNCVDKAASSGSVNLVNQDGDIASMSCVFAPMPPIVITVLEHTGDGNIYIDFSCSEPIPAGSLGIGASYNAYTAENRSWFEENYGTLGYSSPNQYFSYADANFKADPSTYSGTTSISAGATGGTLTIPVGNNKTLFLYRNAVYTTVNSTGRSYTIQYYKDYSRNGKCLTYSYYSSGTRPAECLGTLDYRSGYKVIDSQMGTDYKQLKIRFSIGIDNLDSGSYVSANRFNEYRTNWDFTVMSNTNSAALGSGTSCYQSYPFTWTANGYDLIEATTIFYGTTPTETSRGGFTAKDVYQYQWLVKFVDNKVVVNSYGDYYLLNYVGTVDVN